MRLCAGHPAQPSTFCMSRDGPPITQRTSGLMREYTGRLVERSEDAVHLAGRRRFGDDLWRGLRRNAACRDPALAARRCGDPVDGRRTRAGNSSCRMRRSRRGPAAALDSAFHCSRPVSERRLVPRDRSRPLYRRRRPLPPRRTRARDHRGHILSLARLTEMLFGGRANRAALHEIVSARRIPGERRRVAPQPRDFFSRNQQSRSSIASSVSPSANPEAARSRAT